MKVIYKKPIHDRIMDAQLEAFKHNKTIEKIILTQSEYAELFRYCQQCSSKILVDEKHMSHAGFLIEKEGKY